MAQFSPGGFVLWAFANGRLRLAARCRIGQRQNHGPLGVRGHLADRGLGERPGLARNADQDRRMRARYHAFDDEDRNVLVLYKLIPLPLKKQTYEAQLEKQANAGK